MGHTLTQPRVTRSDPWLRAWVRLSGRGLLAPALIALAACLLLRLGNNTPAILWLGDDGVVLSGAERVLGGQVPYRDFFEFVTPGSFWLYTAAFRLLGTSMATAWLVQLLLGSLIAVAAFQLARAATANWGWGVVAALLATLSAYAPMMGASYHWLAVALSLTGVLPLLGEPGRGRAALAGMVLGLAALAMQSEGGYVAVLVGGWLVATTRWRRQAGWFVAGALVVALLFLAWAVASGVLADLVQDTVLFVFASYAGFNGLGFATDARGLDWGLVLLAVLGPIASLAVSLREPDERRRQAVRLAGCVSVGLLLASLHRPDLAHLRLVVPGALMGTVYLVGRSGQWSAARVRQPWLVWGGLALVIGMLAVPPLPRRWQALPFVDTARGPVAFAERGNEAAAVLAQVQQRVPTGAPVFFYPYEASLNFLSSHPNPTPFSLWPGYNTPAQETQLEQALGPGCADCWVVWDTWFFAADGPARNVYYPGVDVDTPTRLGIESFIQANYAQDSTSGRFLLLRRRSG